MASSGSDRLKWGAVCPPPADAGMTHGETSTGHLLRTQGMQRVPASTIELLSLRGFLTTDECTALIERIELTLRPSTIADFNGDDAFRTSATGDLDAADPVVAELETKLADLTGISPTHGEPIQGQRYEVGQEFKPHTDYFEPDGPDYQRYCAIAGQRTWTAMIYLNNVEAGGGTRFKAIGKTFQPEAGRLLIWNNRVPGGAPNGATLHHGMKVRKGSKYVITRWYRELPWG